MTVEGPEPRDKLPSPPKEGSYSVAHVIARYLADNGVRRVYGLTGSHIKPMWDEMTRAGIGVVDVRHEVAAVHMAHASAELTGALGIATVTAGPGMTNAITGIAASAHARAPVLILSGLVPSTQLGKGAFEELDQLEIVRSLCRFSATVRRPDQVLSLLDRAMREALGASGVSGPAYLDIPIDVLRARVDPIDMPPSWFAHLPRRITSPDPAAISAAVSLIDQSRRPLLISGAAARGAGEEVASLVEAIDCLYLDTRESRGLVSLDHPAYVPAARGRALTEADLIITVGRRLDYELAYGSSAIFAPDAKFLRIGSSLDHLRDNRPGDVEVLGNIDIALTELKNRVATSDRRDQEWKSELQVASAERVKRLSHEMASQPSGSDGKMHPYRLLSALNKLIDDDTILIADGGDILSFAAVALRARTFLTPGSFGCIGVGIPFAIAAALEYPDRRVLGLVGDGSIGFNAMEIHTAVRHKAPIVIVVANNEAWGIERWDRIENYETTAFSTELPGCRYDLLAQSLGAHGEHVEDPEMLDGALQRAMQNAPAVIDVAVTPEARSPDFRNGLADLGDYHVLRAWDEMERASRSAQE